MSFRTKIVSLVLLGVMALSMTGCEYAGIMSAEEREQIKIGMSYSDVMNVVSNPGLITSERGDGDMTVEWSGTVKGTTLTFEDGVVVEKASNKRSLLLAFARAL